MKKAFYTLPITVLLLLTACSQTFVEKVGGEERSNSTKTDEAYQLGDTLKIDDVIVKITDAKQTDPIQFTKSKKGKIVTIDVDVRNNSEDSIFIDRHDFDLISKGEKAIGYHGYEELPLSEEVNREEQADGKLYFDVKPADSYELVYKPNFTADQTEIHFDIPAPTSTASSK